MKSRRLSVFALSLAVATSGACSDFDTTRVVPKRGTLGRELYSLVCDRVGAQALREDVTAASYHDLCHPDATGAYASKVDTSKLVALDPGAVDPDGHVVPIDLQKKHRAYRVARIESLAKRREDLVAAFDAAFPDATIPVKDLASPDPTKSCGVTGTGRLQKELGDVLGRLTDSENDRTIPLVTEALARLMNGVQAAPDAQAALTHFDARQGYRPYDIALGSVRAALSYPRIVPLVNAFLKLVATDSDPFNPAGAIDPSKPLGVHNRRPIPGAASAQFQGLLSVMREELRTSTAPSSLGPLTTKTDPQMPWTFLSRPRSTLELARQVLLHADPAFDDGTAPATKRFIVQRDPRGFAAMAGGAVTAPFVDADGDGLPDLDALGRFVTAGAPVPSPLFSPFGVDGPRDPSGFALGPQQTPLFSYVDTAKTYLAAATRDIRTLVDPDPARETLMKLMAGAPVVFGPRDQNPATTKSYAPDPTRSSDWALAHKAPAPPGLDTSPVTLTYRGFHADGSPIVDLVYALGQLMADPVMDDLLELGNQLVTKHPNELARLIGIGLKIKALADAHPEAHIPQASTLWDELLDTFGKIAHEPGILEDLMRAFEKPDTTALQGTFAAYTEFQDKLTYDHGSTSTTDKLNGPAYNLSTNDNSPLRIPVDRTKPDVGDNRSALQKFMQLLHDANGLSACTKDGAVAHIVWNGLSLDYPSFGAQAACVLTGSPPPPSHMAQCGILRIPNVAGMLLDVALGRAKFDIRDPCLQNLVNSPLSGIVGGADKFLETISGINGFSTHPTVAGVGRLVYFETPANGSPGDTNPATMKTFNFLKDILDPVPSMVCPPAPFTDTDGKVMNLRQCTTFADTLRARDPGFLFPLEQFDFIKNVQALAAAFADHNQPLLFVELFDTMHLHWGSPAQPKDVCDPSLPRTDARWCSQDGTVSYEPLLVDVMRNTDLFQALFDIVPVLDQTQVTHCDAQDPTTHLCTKTSTRSGVTVLSEAVRTLVDPARNVGVVDRHGNAFSLRNDGTKNPQVRKIDLFIDALKGVDAMFAGAADGADRQSKWRSARSSLVDTFLSVSGAGKATQFANASLPKILPVLLGAVRDQILAHCPDRSSAAKCPWATTQLAQDLATTISGPTFAAILDLADAVRQDDAARGELEKLLVYMLDGASDNDAQPTTLAALVDILQALSDDANLSPLFKVVSDAASGAVVADDGSVVKRGLVDASIETLSRVFAKATDKSGHEVCASEIDPNQTIAVVMKKMVTPMGPGKPAPIEVIMDVLADVNRAIPGDAAKLAPSDYANMANEISQFCLDKGRGLEQVYEVIKEATAQ